MANLKPGDAAPAFTLPADDGSEISLSEFRGRYVVLFFFPKALTPG
jgi:peroxiredoxin Q/BCP